MSEKKLTKERRLPGPGHMDGHILTIIGLMLLVCIVMMLL